jgi:hypothetical protein
MEAAFGALYMAPPVFWSLTWPEYRAAMRGWRKYGPASWFSSGDGDTKKKKTKTSIQETLDLMDYVRKHYDGKEKDPRVAAFLKENRKKQRGRARTGRL